MEAVYISATPSDLRKTADSLDDNLNLMKERTRDITQEWLDLDKIYHDPESRIIGEKCKDILLGFEKLSPQLEEVAQRFRDYADWLEKR